MAFTHTTRRIGTAHLLLPRADALRLDLRRVYAQRGSERLTAAGAETAHRRAAPLGLSGRAASRSLHRHQHRDSAAHQALLPARFGHHLSAGRYSPLRAAAPPGDYYLIVSRLIPYKRIDLAIEAFNRLGLPLVIAGIGT